LNIDSLTAVAAYFGRDVATLSTGIKRLTMKISGPGDGTNTASAYWNNLILKYESLTPF